MALRRFDLNSLPVNAPGEGHDANEERFRHSVSSALERGDISLAEIENTFRAFLDVIGPALISVSDPGDVDALEAAIDRLRRSGALSHRPGLG